MRLLKTFSATGSYQPALASCLPPRFMSWLQASILATACPALSCVAVDKCSAASDLLRGFIQAPAAAAPCCGSPPPISCLHAWHAALQHFPRWHTGPYRGGSLFWAPTVKWGISIANIADFSKPTEQISYPQQLAVLATGLIWSRFATQIIPVRTLPTRAKTLLQGHAVRQPQLASNSLKECVSMGSCSSLKQYKARWQPGARLFVGQPPLNGGACLRHTAETWPCWMRGSCVTIGYKGCCRPPCTGYVADTLTAVLVGNMCCPACPGSSLYSQFQTIGMSAGKLQPAGCQRHHGLHRNLSDPAESCKRRPSREQPQGQACNADMTSGEGTGHQYAVCLYFFTVHLKVRDEASTAICVVI